MLDERDEVLDQVEQAHRDADAMFARSDVLMESFQISAERMLRQRAAYAQRLVELERTAELARAEATKLQQTVLQQAKDIQQKQERIVELERELLDEQTKHLQQDGIQNAEFVRLTAEKEELAKEWGRRLEEERRRRRDAETELTMLRARTGGSSSAASPLEGTAAGIRPGPLFGSPSASPSRIAEPVTRSPRSEGVSFGMSPGTRRSLTADVVEHDPEQRLQVEVDSLVGAAAETWDRLKDLERQGSDPWKSMQWDNNFTLLHWAAQHNKPMLCRKLIEMRGAVTLKDGRYNKSPLEFAEAQGCREALEVLREASAAKLQGRDLPASWHSLSMPARRPKLYEASLLR